MGESKSRIKRESVQLTGKLPFEDLGTEEFYVANIDELYTLIEELNDDGLISLNGGRCWYTVGTCDEHISSFWLEYEIQDPEVQKVPLARVLYIER